MLEGSSDNDDTDDSAKKSDDNSNADRAKAPVEHDVADGANAVPVTSHDAVAPVAASAPVSDTPNTDDSAKKSDVVAASTGTDAVAHGRKGVFAVSPPSGPQRKLDSVKRGLALLQSAFDVPNVNELDEHDRDRLRAVFIDATEVYSHDALILKDYDRANDVYDWPALISHVTDVKTMLKTTQSSLEQQLKSGPPKASQPQLKYLQKLGYNENATGNTKLDALTMAEARMLITSLKAAKSFRDA
jgi:hypothetical protein